MSTDSKDLDQRNQAVMNLAQEGRVTPKEIVELQGLSDHTEFWGRCHDLKNRPMADPKVTEKVGEEVAFMIREFSLKAKCSFAEASEKFLNDPSNAAIKACWDGLKNRSPRA